jgi:hypothetical protein
VRWIVRSVGGLLDDPRHVLQPPGGATASAQRLAIQRGRDPPQHVPALAQMADFREHLLAGIGFGVLPVRAETESEPDIPDALTTGALVPQRVPRAWSTTLRLYLRSRSESMLSL